MKKIALPRSYLIRLAKVRHALEIENRQPGEFHGKRLNKMRNLVSVPIGRRWRALFVITPHGYKFRDCLTHEHYNKLNVHAYIA